jgi:hypothetical protein
MFISVRLAKNGYFGSNPKNVLNEDADIVLSVLKYEQEELVYQDTYKALNQRS